MKATNSKMEEIDIKQWLC